MWGSFDFGRIWMALRFQGASRNVRLGEPLQRGGAVRPLNRGSGADQAVVE
jgi:hypothetical protein